MEVRNEATLSFRSNKVQKGLEHVELGLGEVSISGGNLKG